MHFRSTVIAQLGVFVLVVSSVLGAQTGTTSVRGTVTDSTGATVAGANVTLSSADRGFQRTAMSGAAGGYEFLQLQPGIYELVVEMSGFHRYEQKGLQLLVDTPSTINVKLTVGAATDVVEVTAEGEVINTTDASIGNAFD